MAAPFRAKIKTFYSIAQKTAKRKDQEEKHGRTNLSKYLERDRNQRCASRRTPVTIDFYIFLR